MSPMLLVAAVLGCSGVPDAPSAPQPGTPPPSTGDTALPPDALAAPGVSAEAEGQGDALPTPEAAHRDLKRMNLEQVRTAMEQVSGGIAWTYTDWEGEKDYWDAYALTLGVADYQTRLRDNLDPSIMFQKFLDDAAVQTCDAWVAREAAGGAAGGSFFRAAAPTATDPTSVAANLVSLRRAIHGRASAPDAPLINSYAMVFETVLRRTDDPVSAWTTVCVGFFTHPDFFTY